MARLENIKRGQTVTEQINIINDNVSNINAEVEAIANNDFGYVTENDIPVKSVNGKTGDVSLSAKDVGAFPNSSSIKELDLNNIKETGVYIGTYATNPYYLVVIKYNDTNIYQELIGTKFKQYRRFTGVWSEWFKEYSTENPVKAGEIAGINLVDEDKELTLALLEEGTTFVKANIKYNPSTNSLYVGNEKFATEQFVKDAVNMINSVIVNELPENAVENTIYFVPSKNAENSNAFEEYIYVNGKWEIIGGTTIDLTPFLTKTEAENTYAKISSLDDKVSKTTTINGKTLYNNITLTAEDVGALSKDTKVAEDVVYKHTNTQISAKLNAGQFIENDLVISIDEGTYLKGHMYKYNSGSLVDITDMITDYVNLNGDQNINGSKNFNGLLRYGGVNVATEDDLKNVEDKLPTIDSSLSTTSTNPVENKVITTELNKKASQTDLDVLEGIVDLKANTSYVDEQVSNVAGKNDIAIASSNTKYAVSTSSDEISSVNQFESKTSNSTVRMRGCAYGNGIYVITGTSGALQYSTDKGQTWQIISAFTANVIVSVTYGGGYFICVDSAGGIFKSADCINWTQLDSPTSDIINSIVYINGKFALVGSNGLIAFSNDGEKFTLMNSGVTNELTSITRGLDKYVAVSTAGDILVSINGTDWTNNSVDSTHYRTATFGKNIFVIGGQSGKIKYSSDAIHWTDAVHDSTSSVNYIRDIKYANGKFYAVMYISTGEGEIWTSLDGATWSKTQTTSARLWCLGYGNDVLFASGDNGAIWVLNLNITWLDTQPTITSGQYIWSKEIYYLTDGSVVEGEVEVYPEFTNLKNSQFSGDYNDLTNKPTIPSISGLATESYVNTKVANLVNSAPETLDTLGEVATAIQNNASVVEALNSAIGNKANASDLDNYVTKDGYSMRASSTVGKFYYNTGAGEKAVQVKMPTIPVTSVNGQTGDVNIEVPDISNLATKDEIPDTSGFVTTNTAQKITGAKIFSGTVGNTQTEAGIYLGLDENVGAENANMAIVSANTASYIDMGRPNVDYDFRIIKWNGMNGNVAQFEYGGHASGVITIPQRTGTIALTSDIPTINNGTLTIQQNGTTKGTFTANQSGNTTVNFTIPNFVTLTQSEYDALSTKDSNTYYFIKE